MGHCDKIDAKNMSAKSMQKTGELWFATPTSMCSATSAMAKLCRKCVSHHQDADAGLICNWTDKEKHIFRALVS